MEKILLELTHVEREKSSKSKHSHRGSTRNSTRKNSLRLQFELVKWQYWINHNDMRVMITFDGRDAAGKGGTIKRIMAPAAAS